MCVCTCVTISDQAMGANMRTEMKKGYRPSVEKRQKLEEPVIIRQSLRSQGLSPDVGELQNITSCR